MPAVPTTDPFALSRFETAQRDVIDQVRAELRARCKSSHWMWFIFPQLAGLGSSAMARRYALSGIDEARALLAHPVLGVRLLECSVLLLAVRERSAEEILGVVDAQKLRSSMTLFALAAPEEAVFRRVLEKYCDGQLDHKTMERA